MSEPSERPQTPPASEFGTSVAAGKAISSPSSEAKESDITHPSAGYVPRLLDLIYPIPDTNAKGGQHIPPLYLGTEAVDSSRLLGSGASFTASLQRVPKGPERTEIPLQWEGLPVTQSTPAPPRPKFVVYKVARIHFAADGTALPQYQRALQSVLTEIHALTYPPLFQHPNIINFLRFAWGSNPYSPLHRLPAVVVEYAQHGTLASVLERGLPHYDVRLSLCLDVSRGIAAVHRAGLVHGDVKAENVLLCQGPDRKYVAKIADFGFSIVEVMEKPQVWVGGTRPWKAPEAQGPVPLQSLRATDIYSLGLLIWFTAVGRNPFELLPDIVSQVSSRDDEIEEFKQGDKLLKAAHDKWWLHNYVAEELNPKFDDKLRLVMGGHSAAFSRFAMEESGVTQTLRQICFSKVFANCDQQRLFRSLDSVFDHSLRSDPQLRDLDKIIAILKSDMVKRVEVDDTLDTKSIFSMLAAQTQASQGQSTTSSDDAKNKATLEDVAAVGSEIPGEDTANSKHDGKNSRKMRDSARGAKKNARPSRPAAKSSDKGTKASLASQTNPKSPKEISISVESLSWARRGYNKHWMSWQKTRDTEPSVQNLIFDSFPSHGASELFVLAGLYMNGYGCDPDETKALECVRNSAELGCHSARANMHRIFHSFQADDGKTVPGNEYLSDYAIIGSRTAFEQLEFTNQLEKHTDAAEWLRYTKGGVGAEWYYGANMLHGLTQAHWINDAFTTDRIKTIKSLDKYVINKKGDTILHFVASCGRWKPFKSLILDYKMDINLRNSKGETPLLCAVRAGQGPIAIICLQDFKADASIAANNGETPLHWLVTFSDQYIEPLTRDLFANGARVHAMTTERVMHSSYPGTIDTEFKLPGTPLDWAVHNNRILIVKTLLQYGAEPDGTPSQQKQRAGPMKQAAYYHFNVCLQMLIESMEEQSARKTADDKSAPHRSVIYGPLVRNAVHAADKFSMVLRNGKVYTARLHATLDLLREKTERIRFQSQIGGSVLYFAVSELHDEVVEYMLRHDWLTETLNTPSGDACRTPILEAVRWNRKAMYRLLQQRGADVKALASNPFRPSELNWSALHIFAYEGHNRNLSLVEEIIKDGAPVDGISDTSSSEITVSGPPSLTADLSNIRLGEGEGKDKVKSEESEVLPCETPLAVSLRHNAFNFANILLQHGANPNALTTSSGLFQIDHPTTILGHVIIANARYSSARLRHLLDLPSISFVVEPHRQLTALHRCALGFQGVRRVVDDTEVKRNEWDFDTNADIMHELLLKYKSEEQLDRTCEINGNTALQLAVSVGNVRAAEALMRAGADTDCVMNREGRTARAMIDEMKESNEMKSEDVDSILKLLA